MSDCSPLRLADNGNSSPSQSIGSQNSQSNQRQHPTSSSSSRLHNNHRHRHHNDLTHQQSTSSQRTRTSSASSSRSGTLKYGASSVIELFIPVSLCMLIVVLTMKATDNYRYSSQTSIWYIQMMFTDQSVDTGTRVWQSFANAFMMLVLIAVMTTVLIVLYKLRCYKTIHGWLILSSLVLLFMFAIMYVGEILKVYNIPMDNYTLAIFIWNFGVVGMICIHWKGPLLLQQGYLIVISALLALVFIRSLPDWTTWTVLAIVSIWDLIAVLCPNGPLRILVETAQERGENIFPALIYSSTVIWEICTLVIASTIPYATMADNNQQGSNKTRNNKRKSNSDKQTGGSSGRRSDAKRIPSQGTSMSSTTGQVSSMSSPTKRNQHPVEIQYEEGAQAPEVAFIQPANISGTSEANDDNWTRPVVRSVPVNHRSQTSSGSHAAIDPAATALTINLHPSNESRLEESMVEERGVKLGLGDFIFYSLLVGKASSYGDWTITLSCYVSILVGLCLTLSLLSVFHKALPALPISITFGLSAFFLSYAFVVPFAGRLAVDQVFI